MMAGDSKGKDEKQITIRLPNDLFEEMMDYADKKGQYLSYPAYFLLGFLYAHDVAKDNLSLALRILSRVVATNDDKKIDRLYKSLLRKWQRG